MKAIKRKDKLKLVADETLTDSLYEMGSSFSHRIFKGEEGKSLLSELAPSHAKVLNLVKSGTDGQKDIARELKNIRNAIQKHYTKDIRNVRWGENEVGNAFDEFAEQEFGFQRNRAREYANLGDKENILTLDLPISHLIELSRLYGDSLNKAIEQLKNEENYSRVSFRWIKQFVQSFNQKSKKNKSKQKSEIEELDDLIGLAPSEKSGPLDKLIDVYEEIQSEDISVPDEQYLKIREIIDFLEGCIQPKKSSKVAGGAK